MNVESQLEILSDKNNSGYERPWQKKKDSNSLLALSYESINPRKAIRLKNCAMQLTFEKKEDNSLRLEEANFCRVRLCPMCSWRRALKVFIQTKKIANAIDREHNFCYLFLTLTIKNCSGENLDATLDHMLSAWRRFMAAKEIKSAVKGWFRSLEITHNVNYGSSSYDTYHPHFHCILTVGPHYFKDRSYIKQATFVQLWKHALRASYDPIIDVKRVKGTFSKVIAEVAKYAVLEKDYIVPHDWDLTVDTVRLLDRVLDNRRFVAYGGLMKIWHKKLNFDDELDGDLINFKNNPKPLSDAENRVTFMWFMQFHQYFWKK